MVPAKAGKSFGPNVGLDGFLPGSRRESGYRLPGSGPKGRGVCRVGAAVWPSGATLAAEAVFMVAAVAASTVAPRNRLRRSRCFVPRSVGRGKWGSVVVIFFLPSFLLEGNDVPAIGHNAGEFRSNNLGWIALLSLRTQGPILRGLSISVMW